MQRLFCIAFCTLALSGCENKTAHVAVPASGQTPFKTELTIKQIMEQGIDPAADVVWNATGFVVDEKGTIDLSPKTPEGWQNVVNHATMVAELSNALMIAGRAPEAPEWDRYAGGLHAVAIAAMHAAEAHDKAALLRIGGEMDTACDDCHKRFVFGK